MTLISSSTPLQRAHLAEVGTSHQRHLYARPDNNNLLSPAHAAAAAGLPVPGGSAASSRRVSAAGKSAAGDSTGNGASGSEAGR